jgi:hypothetical protein
LAKYRGNKHKEIAKRISPNTINSAATTPISEMLVTPVITDMIKPAINNLTAARIPLLGGAARLANWDLDVVVPLCPP